MLERNKRNLERPDSPEMRPVPEVMIPERLIKLDSNSINLEITEMCRTDCNKICYTAGRARLTGEHLSPEILYPRINWICRHTDAKYLFLLGGEPLLHPQLREIIDYANRCGLGVNVITSGVISGRNKMEQDNLVLLLEKYQDGTLGVQPSLHPGRNQRHFLRIINELEDRTPARMSALQAKKQALVSLISRSRPFDAVSEKGLNLLQKRLNLVDELLVGKIAVSTTVTMGSEFAADEKKFIAIYRFLLESCQGWSLDTISINDEVDVQVYLHQQFEKLVRHFAPFGLSEPFVHNLYVSWPANKTWHIRFWGAVSVTKTMASNNRQVIQVKRPMGNERNAAACPAMTSSSDNDSGETFLNGALIRADGELVPSQPGCIEMKRGFANVDEDKDSAAIYGRISARLTAIDILIHKIDNLHQSERPTADKGCASCPFDIACNLCVNNGAK